jgi:protein-arginine kinase
MLEVSCSLPISAFPQRDSGIFHNNDENVFVWINEEDHTRLISMEKGDNVKEIISFVVFKKNLNSNFNFQAIREDHFCFEGCSQRRRS